MPDVTMKDPDGGEYVVGNPGDQALLASRGYTVFDRSAPSQSEQGESSPVSAEKPAAVESAPAVEDTSAPSTSKATTRRSSQ